MKKVLIAIVAVVFLFSVNYAIATTGSSGQPFAELWEAIENISLTPGPPGPPAPTGAGQVAFADEEQGTPAVMLLDGSVWKYSGGIWITNPAWSPPMPVTDIVVWKSGELILDINGDTWVFPVPWVRTTQPW